MSSFLPPHSTNSILVGLLQHYFRPYTFLGEDLEEQGVGNVVVDDAGLGAAGIDFTHAFSSSSGGLPCKKR